MRHVSSSSAQSSAPLAASHRPVLINYSAIWPLYTIKFVTVGQRGSKQNATRGSISSISQTSWVLPKLGQVVSVSTGSLSPAHWPVRIQATLTSPRSGSWGSSSSILSPGCRPHVPPSTLAAFLDCPPNSSKLPLTSAPMPLTHQKAGIGGRCPA